MSKIATGLLFHDGTSRSTRMSPMLDPAYCSLYDLSIPDHTRLLLQLAENIPFFNEENRKEGNWKKMLWDNETIALMYLASYDTDKKTEQFFKHYYNAKTEFSKTKKEQLTISLIHFLTGLLTEIDECYKGALSSKRNTAIIEEIQTIAETRLRNKTIPSLLYLSQKYPLYHAQLLEKRSEWHSVLASIWKMPGMDKPGPRIDDGDLALTVRIFHKLIHALERLKNFANENLDLALRGNDHPPHIALLLAFLKLFDHNRHHLNSLVQRHLDYYYKEVLAIIPPPPVADQVYVCLRPANHIDRVLIPADSLFLAGKTETNEDILYSTTVPLLVNQSTVDQVKTIYVQGNDGGNVSMLYNNSYDAATVADETVSWPAFGMDELKNTGLTRQTCARIGFAITSPVLFLNEGDREICIALEIHPDSLETLEKMIASVSKDYNIKEEDAFFKVFSGAFNISITTDTGWSIITNYILASSWSHKDMGKGILQLNMYLDSGFPSVIGYDEKLHGNKLETYNSSSPVISILVNENAAIYCYSFIAPLVLTQIKINVNVKGIQKFTGVNQHGIMNTSQPFFPFGNAPTLDSYFIIGQKEVFYKNLDQLELELEWAGLPQGELGFAEHYAAYPGKIFNESFQCRLSVLNKYRWMPAGDMEKQKVFLFESVQPSGEWPDYSLKPVTKMDYIDTRKIKLAAETKESYTGDLVYSNESKRGFIKLELCAPEIAFGVDEYPVLFSESIRRKKNKLAPDPVPLNKPYIPLLNRLTIGYSASAVINFVNYPQSIREGNMYYHLVPFGLKAIGRDVPADSVTILAYPFNEGGYMYIGLKNLDPPDTISLLFRVVEKTDYEESLFSPQPLELSYLKNNAWEKIPPGNLLGDSTRSLTKPGIINMEIPGDIALGNSILPADCYWIKITSPNREQSTVFLQGIMTQAVTAVRSSSPLVNNLVIAAGSIKNFQKKIPEISEVDQPLPSFGGRAAYGMQEYYQRAAERLRHKKRTVNIWDYEHMVQDAFPGIYKAKCIPVFDAVTHTKELKMVIFPSMKDVNHIDLLMPGFSSPFLLKVKDYLSRYMPAFCKLNVINPHYERIKVFGRIRMLTGYNNGYYMQQVNNEIINLLSPWIKNTSYDVPFGEALDITTVLSMIAAIPIVDEVEQLEALNIYADGELYQVTVLKPDQRLNISPKYPWSLFTSAARHSIHPQGDEEFAEAGLNALSIAEDFIIT